MDREELRAKAAARRSAANPLEGIARYWRCEYCQHDFARETTFMRHRCKERERIEQLRSPVGHAAFAAYNTWMKVKGRSEQTIETFAVSSFYSAFIRFAEFAKRSKLPDMDAYLRFMVKSGDVSPTDWTNHRYYSMWVRTFDDEVAPEVQFEQSLKLLEELAVDHGVTLPEVFTVIDTETLSSLIARRRLSVWLLVASGVFKQYLLGLPEMEKQMVAEQLGISSFPQRVARFKGRLETFTAFCKEIGL